MGLNLLQWQLHFAVLGQTGGIGCLLMQACCVPSSSVNKTEQAAWKPSGKFQAAALSNIIDILSQDTKSAAVTAVLACFGSDWWHWVPVGVSMLCAKFQCEQNRAGSLEAKW